MERDDRIAELERILAERTEELAAARAESRFFRKVLDGVPDVVSVLRLGPTGFTTAYANASLERATGISPDEARTRNVIELVHPDDRRRVGEAARALLTDGGQTRIEYRRANIDGGYSVMEAIARAHLDDPDVRGIINVGREIDEAVRLREELHQARARLERALQIAREAVWERDIVGDHLELSESVYEQLGYAAGELVPEIDAVRELIHPDDREPLRERFAAHLATGAPLDVEIRVRRRSGEHRWYRLLGEAVRDAEGRPQRVIGRMADVHDRKSAEIALARSERMFRALFEGTSAAVTLRDVHEQTFLDCNDAAVRLFGCLSREELRNTKPWQLCPEVQPDGRPTEDLAREVIGRALREGVSRFEWRARRLTGEEFDASLRITVIEFEDGRRVMQTFIEDISEQKRADAEALQRARREALVGKVSRRFVESTADVAVPFALEVLGEHLGARRVALHMLSAEGGVLRSGPEWRADGVPSARLFASDTAVCAVPPWMLERLRADGFVAVVDVRDVRREIPACLGADARAVLLVPLASQQGLLGAIVAERDASGAWDEDDVSLGRVVAEIVSMGRARAEAEAGRRASEALYRGLVDRSRDPILVSTLEPRVVFASAEYTALLGYTPEDIASTPDILLRTVAPESAPLLQAILEEARATGEVPHDPVVWTWMRKDGKRLVFETIHTPVREGGRLVQVQSISRDVTQRHRADEARRRHAAREELLGEVSRRFLDDAPEVAIDAALERFGAMLDADRVTLLTPDPDTALLRTTRRWLGPTASPLTHDPLEGASVPAGAFTTPGDLSASSTSGADAWLVALREEPAANVRHAVVGYGGRAFGVLAARLAEGREWADEDLATLRAIGELVALGRVRRATEAALARAKEDAVAASLTKSAFLANMSHELRTPLNGVIGMVDLLAATSLDERQRRYADVARDSAKLLLAVITDILDFSRIEAGKFEIAAVPFDLPELVREVTGILALGAEEKGIALTSECDLRLVGSVVGDAHRLRQVLVNLVTNAIKFTARGSVRIRAMAVSESPVTVRARVEVQDTGIGISGEQQSRLFRPFTQLDASAARQHGGTGLGLAICREIVTRMGGQIGVTSAAGMGATFWFELSFERAAEPVRKEPVRELPAPRATEGARVLLVEDSPINAEVAGEILRSAGYALDHVGDGAAAIEAVRARKYDLVLMDCQLPGVDGYQATREIRALERAGMLTGARPLPIVALTASATKEDVERCFHTGMTDYVSKPVDARRLLGVLARHLRAERTADRAPSVERPPREDTSRVANLDNALARLRGDHSLLRRIVTQFADGAPDACAALRRAVDRRDSRGLEFAAHRLRGQAASFDADALGAAARALEESARREHWPSAGQQVATVEREMGRLLKVLLAAEN